MKRKIKKELKKYPYRTITKELHGLGHSIVRYYVIEIATNKILDRFRSRRNADKFIRDKINDNLYLNDELKVITC